MAKAHKYRCGHPDYKEKVHTRLTAWRRRKMAKLSEAQGHRCAYCCRETYLGVHLGDPKPKHLGKGQKATLDHLIPQCHPVQTNKDENLVMACSSCNSLRGVADPMGFFKCLRNLVKKQKPKSLNKEKIAKQELKKQKAFAYAFFLNILYPDESKQIIAISDTLKPKGERPTRRQQINLIARQMQGLDRAA